MKLTKAELKKALKKEKNLQQGSWVEFDALPEVGSCTVCAVGAVLRHGCGLENNVLSEVIMDLDVDAAPSDDDYYDEPRRGAAKWLTALSGVFEDASTAQEGLEAAIALIDSDEFPETITIPETSIKRARLSARRRLVYDNDDLCYELFSEKRADKLLGDPDLITDVELKALSKAVTKRERQ